MGGEKISGILKRGKKKMEKRWKKGVKRKTWEKKWEKDVKKMAEG